MNFSSCISLRPFSSSGWFMLLALVFTGVFASPVSAQTTPSADIVVFKSGDETVALGGQITYTLSVYNAGPDEAVNVVLTDAIPANTTFVSASTDTGSVSFDGTTVTVNVGTLAFDTTAIATLVVRVNEDTPRGTIISNTVSGTSDTFDPDSLNNSATALTTVTGPFAGDFLISEFRLRGPDPNGASNEFIELYNNTDAPVAVSTTDGSSGWAVAASDGVVRFVIPNGTIIPARGHFLGVNSDGYSLSSYPSGNDATATGDATYTLDIADNAGIAVFRTSDTQNFSTATRLDAVGSSAEANTLYREGPGYAPVSPTLNTDFAFVRDTCGKGGSITTFGACPTNGLPKDTDNNASDFYFVDVNGTSAGAGQRLGAPGPENLASPTQQNAGMTILNLDQTVGSASPPNRVRNQTSDPANNSTFGTLDFRRRVVNSTGFPVTRLRFRLIDITTFPAPSGFADLRARTSTDLTGVSVNDPNTCPGGAAPCTVTVLGTTLEQPPGQLNGGGFNSSLSSDTVTLLTPIAPGDSINLHFLFGVQQTGLFKFYINVELLTDQSGGEGEGELFQSGFGVGKTARGTSRRAEITEPSPRPAVQSSGIVLTPRIHVPQQTAPESKRSRGGILLEKRLGRIEFE